MNPWVVAAAIWLVSRYLYNKLNTNNDPTVGPNREKEITIPRIEEGSPYPMIFGRYIVTSPILAWAGKPGILDDTQSAQYFISLFYNLGIGFEYGHNRIHGMFAGKQRMTVVPDVSFTSTGVTFDDLHGAGTYELPPVVNLTINGVARSPSGYVEFLNGRGNIVAMTTAASQQALVDVDGTAFYTHAGELMSSSASLGGTIDNDEIPGYRGFMCVCLYGDTLINHGFSLGNTPQVSSFGFEVSSYASSLTTQPDDVFDHCSLMGFRANNNLDENPASVIFEILHQKRGKLGIPVSRIDTQSFLIAGGRLYSENHGYSRVWEVGATAEEMLDEILKQIDGVLYLDNTTSLIKLKLIRNDYDINTIPQITDSNAQNFTVEAVGWVDLPNKLRIKFRNREKDYTIDSVVAQDLSAIVANGMSMREETIDMPGICYGDLANRVAERELFALSRPLQLIRADVDRTKLRLNPGDAVKVLSHNPDVSGVFRVVDANRGTLESNKISLTLIQDIFYTPPSGGKKTEPTKGGIPFLDFNKKL